MSSPGRPERRPGDGPGGRPVAEWAYWAVGSLVVGLLVAAALRGLWATDSDIWEHAAVVRELERHPLRPGHPLMAIDAPHSFFSPYALALGLIARLTPLSAAQALALAGPANAALLVIGLRAFVRRFSPRPAAPLWALGFTWLLWGPDPWFYSSFLHLRALPYVAAYPSTFTKGVVLLALAIGGLLFAAPRVRPWPPVALVLLTTVVALTHPVDVIYLAVGLAALAIGTSSPRGVTANLGVGAACGVAGMALALLWPLFPLADLVVGQAEYRRAVAGGDHDLYEKVLSRTWPSLVVVPAVVRRLRRRATDPLGLSFLVLLGVYGVGFVTAQWQLGRVISDLLLVGHVALAVEVAGLPTRPTPHTASRAGPVAVRVALVGLLLVGARSNRESLATLVPPSAKPSWLERFAGAPPALSAVDEVAFLTRHVGEDDVVLGDFGASWMVPLHSGKVVPSRNPLGFVPDLGRRREDALGFFAPDATAERRWEVIGRYCARFLLLPRRYLDSAEGRGFPIAEFGPPVHEDGRNVLVALRLPSNDARPACPGGRRRGAR